MEAKAVKFAKIAHEGQKRKFSGNPYYKHPVRVAETLESVGATEEAVLAGYLHDVVEDTSYDIADVAERFGPEVASIVLEMTNDEERVDEVGKTEYMKHKMVGMSDEALLVKLADRLDNTSDFDTASDSFASRYAEETGAVLDHLEEVRSLHGVHKRLVNRIRENLKNVD
jgi:(p)ppGpp synthase/HD superfamily hydrolase